MKCPVCEGDGKLLDVVDLNRSCVPKRDARVGLSGVPVYYAVCESCGFCWSPTMYEKDLEWYRANIYNAGYEAVDPDYVSARALKETKNLLESFPDFKLKHLDYGGGNCRLSLELIDHGWDSWSCDPFVESDLHEGKYSLITAIEVFEHVPAPHKLFEELTSLLEDDGIVIFTTLLSDGQLHTDERIKWWYIAPRNGHVGVWSKKSLEFMVRKYGFNARSSERGFHVLFRKRLPVWAEKLL